MTTEYYPTLKDYIAIMRGRVLLLSGVFGIVFAGAVAVAVLLPPVYRSTGTIMVESQRIPAELVQSTITGFADERIEIIKQRVMTRDNLLKIVGKYRLFDDDGGSRAQSALIDEMRSRIGIELISNSSGHRGKATIAFRVSFEHQRPEVAHRVASELVTLFLDENVRARTERASEATQFFAQEAERLKAELDKLESQVARYKREYGNALPEHMSLRMNMAERLEAELRHIEREYKAAQEELSFLDLELAAAKSGVSLDAAQGASSSPAAELERLRADLALLVGRYSENHPDVRALRRKISVLEATVEKGGAALAAGSPASPVELVIAKIEAKIATTNARAASLVEQQKSLGSRLNQLQGQIIQSPQVERVLLTLMRDHENAQKKYEEVRAKQMSAQMAENLEGENKAERFSLLDPPLLPDMPIKPNRKKVVGLGFFLAVGGSVGLVMMLESLAGRVRGLGALTAVVRDPPLAVIPYITTSEELAHRKAMVRLAIILSLALAVAAAAAMHYLHTSLDLMMLKILTRFE